jgi:hypothetical protein
MHQAMQSPIAEIVIQDSAGFRKELLHSGGIWMESKMKPLCLQWERQMLRQNMTREKKEAIPMVGPPLLSSTSEIGNSLPAKKRRDAQTFNHSL